MTEEHTSELQSHDNLVCLEFRRVLFRSEEHTSELQSHDNLVCRLLLEKNNRQRHTAPATPLTQCGSGAAAVRTRWRALLVAVCVRVIEMALKCELRMFFFFFKKGAPPEPPPFPHQGPPQH